MAMRTPSPWKAAMVCRVSVKFSIGSRSVSSSTTCESLIGEPAKILRTSLTIPSSQNSLAGKLNEIFGVGQLFCDEGIVKDVRKILAGSPIKLSQVVLELTERDPIENFTETRQTIAAFQGLGVRIAIDDVGTGHSGLSYMLKLGVDIIKIDKMFVDAIGTDRNSTTIVETLVDLAHNMRMDVVAEGVENFEQVMYLRELGVRSAQGYVFAPPLPGKSFLQLVEAIDPRPAAAAEPKTEMADAQASAQVSAA